MFAGSNLDNLRATGPHLSADDARALITRVGLPHDLLKCDADTLSGGEAQRLCLARALAARPQAILAGIIVFAAVTITRRAPHVPVLRWGTLLANVLVAVSALAINFGIGELTGRALVPVAGMVIGNSMKAADVAAPRVSEPTADQRAEIEARLALGMSVPRASARVIRSSLRTAISPQIEQTAALGIVFLPGAMTVLILAGADSLEAVRTQLALMYVILTGVVIAAVITGLGTLRQLTTDQQTLLCTARR